MKFSKKIVTLVILLNVAFTSAVLWISNSGMIVPDALIISWFAFTGTELFGLTYIKVQDIKGGSTAIGESIQELKDGITGVKDEVITQKEIFKGGILNAKVILDKDSE